MRKRRDNLFGLEWVEAEDGSEYRFDIVVTAGDPGRTYGPPETCYPPEPSEMVDCTLSGPVEGNNLMGQMVAQGEEEIAAFLKQIGATETFDVLVDRAVAECDR